MKITNLIFCIILFAFISNNSYIHAQIQWRGENRTGIYNETGLLKKWPEAGPSLLWNYTGLGKGHTSVTIANNTIYTTGETLGVGCIFAFDLTGNLLWKSEYGKEWDESYPGSRTSPTYNQGKLYFL